MMTTLRQDLSIPNVNFFFLIILKLMNKTITKQRNEQNKLINYKYNRENF